MLKKLLKYDLKNVYKVLVIFYALSLFFAVLTRVFLSIENSFIMNIIGRVCSGVTISMIFNVLINNILRMWSRFRTNLYSDEGYLTHTLPVTKTQLYASKTVCAIISLFVSFAVIGITFFIAYYSKENIEMVKGVLLPMAKAYNSSIVAILCVFLFILFLQFFNILQCGTLGIILGHRMNSSKIGYSVLFGFVSYLASQNIALLGVFICSLFSKELMNLFITNDIVGIEQIKTILLIAIIIYAVIISIVTVVSAKLFKKGVNLD